MTNHPSGTGAAAVLDTNVVLDWLLFREPRVAPLAAAIEGGGVDWLACAYMREELSRVLTYGALQAWAPDRTAILAAFDRHARILPGAPAHRSLRSADPDDQAFVDLACAHGARWLFSRDKALLRLARRASALGLDIVTPARWAPPALP